MYSKVLSLVPSIVQLWTTDDLCCNKVQPGREQCHHLDIKKKSKFVVSVKFNTNFSGPDQTFERL